jgi:hypothetical protein
MTTARDWYNPLPGHEPVTQADQDKVDTVRCLRLWTSVLSLALEDAQFGEGTANTRYGALSWLLSTSGDLKKDRYLVAELCGIDPQALDNVIDKRRTELEGRRQKILASRPKAVRQLKKMDRPLPRVRREKLAPTPAPYQPTLDELRAELLRRGIHVPLEEHADGQAN